MTPSLSETTRMREAIAAVGRSLFDRGLTHGATGNISVRLDDGSMLITPTNVSLGELDPGRLSLLDPNGMHLSGDRPSKEAFLHTCMYCERKTDTAVIHLHSTHAVAVSTLAGLDENDVLPPLTAYYVMGVGRMPLVPYHRPGDSALALAVKRYAAAHHAVLLANHGPVVSGRSLRDALFATEELEETAKLFLLLEGRKTRSLTRDEVAVLEENAIASD